MTTITKILLVTILMATTLTTAIAQNTDTSKPAGTYDACKQRFKSEKVAYISSRMNFSVEEAQQFWPLYNKYDAIFDEIGEARRQNYSRKECMKNYDKMTNEKAGDIIAKSFEYDSQELDTRRKYHEELSKLFSQKQILLYYHLEHEFRRQKLSDNKPVGNSFGKSFKTN
ncbi:MAG: hypothetical protein K6F33_04150 [Bacteroidales bacterium]|nr:hypothetical protein [Bacteroidales bacterium]